MLDLQYNNINTAGAQILADALRVNKVRETSFVFGNCITL